MSDVALRSMNRAMVAIVLGVTVASLDGTTVATALPTIVADLGGLDQLPMIVTAYMLAATITLPLYGRWSDATGRKPMFVIAQVVFILGAILAATAASTQQLIAYRAIQGAGAGGLMVLAQAIVGDMVPARQRSRYLGWIGALFATGSIAGPVVGGFVADRLGWQWVFRMLVPVGIAGLIATWKLIPTIKHDVRVVPDFNGSLLLGGALTALVLVATWGGSTYAWADPLIIGLGVLFVVLSGLLVAVERRVGNGVLPIGFLRRPGVPAAMIVALVTGSTIFGFIVFTPVFLQIGAGKSATFSGMVLLPLMGAFMVTSVVVGRVIWRLGRYRSFPIAGTALIALSFLLLSTMSPSTSYTTIAFHLVIGGAGVGMVMQVVVLAMQTSAAQDQLGVATSMAQLFRSIGGAVGVAFFGSLLSVRLVAEFAAAGIATDSVTPRQIMETPSLIEQLAPALQQTVREATASSVTFVFAISVPVTLIALLAAFRLHDRELSEAADD